MEFWETWTKSIPAEEPMIFEGSECQFQRCTQPHTYANACGLQMGSKRCNSICIGAIRTICTLTVRLLLVIMDHFLSVQVLVSHLILYILLKLCAFQTPNDSQRDRNYMANRVKNANKSRSTQLIQLASHMLRIRVCVYNVHVRLYVSNGHFSGLKRMTIY